MSSRFELATQRHEDNSGAAIAGAPLSKRYAPSSTVAHPSVAQPLVLVQQPLGSVPSWCAAKSPADSNPQCCVASSQKASKQPATILFRKRLTATTERWTDGMSTLPEGGIDAGRHETKKPILEFQSFRRKWDDAKVT